MVCHTFYKIGVEVGVVIGGFPGFLNFVFFFVIYDLTVETFLDVYTHVSSFSSLHMSSPLLSIRTE